MTSTFTGPAWKKVCCVISWARSASPFVVSGAYLSRRETMYCSDLVDDSSGCALTFAFVIKGANTMHLHCDKVTS